MPRLLCIMGSGETAPTMTSVHSDLIRRMGGDAARPVLLDTPFGFQENADELVARTQEHFRKNVGYPIEVASFRRADAATEVERESALSRIQQSAYVFAGPGSPSYALNQWRGTQVGGLLVEKLERGGCVVFASAAAVSLGRVSLPVYEIYKVGQPPHWLEGLDVLSAAGISAAVIPHFNNAEGGTHDTRFCYMGAPRLNLLEAMLPAGTAVLGVDEHTALVIDLEQAVATVRGRGRVVLRQGGGEQVYASGAQVSLEALRAAAAGRSDAPAAQPATGAGTAPDTAAEPAAVPFLALLDEQRRRFEDGAANREVEAMVGAILGVDTMLTEWEGETYSDEMDRARSLLRRLVVRLGELAAGGVADPRDRVAPFVDMLLDLRRQARAERRFADADRLRDLLIERGVEVRDSRDGSAWEFAGAAPPP